MVGTFRIVRYIMGVRTWGVFIRQGSIVQWWYATLNLQSEYFTWSSAEWPHTCLFWELVLELYILPINLSSNMQILTAAPNFTCHMRVTRALHCWQSPSGPRRRRSQQPPKFGREVRHCVRNMLPLSEYIWMSGRNKKQCGCFFMVSYMVVRAEEKQWPVLLWCTNYCKGSGGVLSQKILLSVIFESNLCSANSHLVVASLN